MHSAIEHPVSLRGKLFLLVYLLVLLNETDYMEVLPVCHHPNAISEDNKAFHIYVIILDYQLLNLLPPKAHVTIFNLL
jgi:hypothetical protein